MNEITIYQSPEEMEREKERWKRNSYAGYVYAIEFGDNVKIGFTCYPMNRIRELTRFARNYCLSNVNRIAISPAHNGGYRNEAMLHSKFADKRLEDGELFSIEFEEAVEAMSQLEYIDNSEELKKCDREANEPIINAIKEYNSPKNVVKRALIIIDGWLSDEYSKLCSETISLGMYAPRGTNEFFSLLEKYDDKTRSAMLHAMMEKPKEEQVVLLKNIWKENVLPDFLLKLATT